MVRMSCEALMKGRSSDRWYGLDGLDLWQNQIFLSRGAGPPDVWVAESELHRLAVR